jgi:hypothetical protein
VVTYSLFDFKSSATRNIIWGSQAVVITMRFLAACEMARRILARYAGTWAFAQRVLLIVAAGVLLYTAVFSDKHLSMMILTVDRGAELAIASFIVGLLLFARYYRLEISPLDRALSIGFSLYSCFYVIMIRCSKNGWNRIADFGASWMSSRSWLACSSGSRRFACMLRPGNSSTPRACLPTFTEHYPLK